MSHGDPKRVSDKSQSELKHPPKTCPRDGSHGQTSQPEVRESISITYLVHDPAEFRGKSKNMFKFAKFSKTQNKNGPASLL
jgi:hypothetical protein